MCLDAHPIFPFYRNLSGPEENLIPKHVVSPRKVLAHDPRRRASAIFTVQRQVSLLGQSPTLLKDKKVSYSSNPPVFVIDNGSGVIKAGFGHSSRPSMYHAYVGRPKYKRVMSASLNTTRQSKQLVVGRRCRDLRGVLKIDYPTSSGVVTDWYAQQKLWMSVYEDMRAIPNHHPVLITVPPTNNLAGRRKTAEVFLEELQAPSVCFQIPQVLGLYARGHTTGVIVDSGDTLTSAVPIYEGQYSPAAVNTIPVGGRHITKYLSKLLRDIGHNLFSTSDLEVVKRIKESMCETNVTRKALQKKHFDTVTEDYRLPDGKIVRLGRERVQAPELLFQPSIIGLEHTGVCDIVLDAIQKSPFEQRRRAAGRVVLQGGSTLSKGFAWRMLVELKHAQKEALQHRYQDVFSSAAVSATLPNEYLISKSVRYSEPAWLGGAVLSTIDSIFPSMSITRLELAEYGQQIFFRKRPQDGTTGVREANLNAP